MRTRPIATALIFAFTAALTIVSLLVGARHQPSAPPEPPAVRVDPAPPTAGVEPASPGVPPTPSQRLLGVWALSSIEGQNDQSTKLLRELGISLELRFEAEYVTVSIRQGQGVPLGNMPQDTRLPWSSTTGEDGTLKLHIVDPNQAANAPPPLFTLSADGVLRLSTPEVSLVFQRVSTP